MSYAKHLAYYQHRYPAISDLVRRARRRTPPVAWAYLESGTGTEALLQRNRDALEAITFQPRFCRGILEPDLKSLFGRNFRRGLLPMAQGGLGRPRSA